MSRKESRLVVPLRGRAKSLAQALVESLGRMVAAPLDLLSGRSRPLLPDPGRERCMAVQDRDPYLETLLLALYRRKREVKKVRTF